MSEFTAIQVEGIVLLCPRAALQLKSMSPSRIASLANCAKPDAKKNKDPAQLTFCKQDDMLRNHKN